MQHNSVFCMEPSGHPELTTMPIWLGWYPRENPDWIPTLAPQRAWITCNNLEALPPGKRVVFMRWVLMYESYMSQGADPLQTLETGRYAVGRSIRYLRAFGRELRARNMYLDGIYLENEGGFTSWNLTPQQMQAIYASSRARAKMPPRVRALSPEMFHYTHPNYQNAVTLFNRYTMQIHTRAMRQITVGSGIFKIARAVGQAPVNPDIVNFNHVAPTFTAYDYNGWPWQSLSVDGKSSAPSVYFGTGSRYFHPDRVHMPLWNSFIDHLNLIRSCLRRPNGTVWPVISWPRQCNPWLFEQLIAHCVRSGVNWTAGRMGYYYWREPWLNGAVEDPYVAETFNRHDQPFPVQRNLPEIPIDCDRVETAGFVTTYADCLANVPPDAAGNINQWGMSPIMSPRSTRLAPAHEMAIS